VTHPPIDHLHQHYYQPPPKKNRTWFIVLLCVVAVVIFIFGLVLVVGGSSGSDADGTAPSNADTTGAPSTSTSTETAARETVKVVGTGESVKTVKLDRGAYTVKYHAANSIIVAPVNSDGSEGLPFINGFDFDKAVDGTAPYSAVGPVTLHVWNTTGPWTLTFTPLN